VSEPFQPDPRWLTAIAAGTAMTVVLIGVGIWAIGANLPLLWVFLGPWGFVGVLLVVWGWQRRPRRE
jgi:hypothetical protein